MSGRLASIDSPDPGLEKAEALLADPKATAILRPGFKVSLQLNINGPPKDAQGYRQALSEAIGAKLKQNGLIVVEDGEPSRRPNVKQVSYIPSAARLAGPDARLVIDAREKDSGKTIQYRRIGRGGGEIQVVKLIDLSCEMSLVDASRGRHLDATRRSIPMQPFGFVLRMPAGEIRSRGLPQETPVGQASRGGPPPPAHLISSPATATRSSGSPAGPTSTCRVFAK